MVWQKAEGRKQKAEGRRQKAEGRGSISMKAVKLEIGVLRPEAAGQEAGGKRKKERGRRKEP
ncbi:hypothetical protein QUB05_05885 [Microcoleus sp. F10-C6]|uniref:hypothetical protein n=1 Tax=unclassified Microcoleus TaxID=2642155 RepID=UPI002FD67C55